MVRGPQRCNRGTFEIRVSNPQGAPLIELIPGIETGRGCLIGGINEVGMPKDSSKKDGVDVGEGNVEPGAVSEVLASNWGSRCG